MKKILLYVCFVFIAIGNGWSAEVFWHSQIKGDINAKGLNGYYWKQLTKVEKTVYILAFDEGMFLYGVELVGLPDSKVSNEDRARLDKNVTDNYLSNATTEEIMHYIDKIYTNDSNLNIPILWARRLLLFDKKGIDTTDMIMMLRKESELIKEVKN